jgi:FAD-dependent monooxygenase
MVPPGTDPYKIDALDFIYGVLGGLAEPYPVEVDEVLVKSIWQADVGITDFFRSTGGRVFLAGDAGEARAFYNVLGDLR